MRILATSEKNAKAWNKISLIISKNLHDFNDRISLVHTFEF